LLLLDFAVLHELYFQWRFANGQAPCLASADGSHHLSFGSKGLAYSSLIASKEATSNRATSAAYSIFEGGFAGGILKQGSC